MNSLYRGKPVFELHADVLNEKTSIYALYEEQGLHIERAVESIEAVMPSTALRKELYMNEGEPLFRKGESLMITRTGRWNYR